MCKRSKNMKKKILLVVALVSILVCLFAITASAARVEDYEDTFTLQSGGQIVHYEKWQYTNGSNSYVRKGYTDNVVITFVDENGAPLTEVAMWEYDEIEDKYYSLVWYISDYKLTWEDQTYSDSNVGDQTYPKYTAATYTLSKARAVDLRYVINQYNTTHDVWKDADGNKITYSLKSLKAVYHTNGTPNDTTDDIRLHHAQGIGRDTDNYGYVGYDAQFAATGNKIVVANFRDCDFERDEEGNYGTANTWSRADNLQCLWYPDTMKYICAGIGPVYEIDVGDGMEVIGCQILRDNKRVKEIVIPNSVLFLNNEAFRGSDLTKLTIGEGLISHGSDPFLYTGGADTIVMSKNLLDASYTGNVRALVANTKATILFVGTKEEAEALVAKIQNGVTNYNTVAYYDYSVTQTRESTNGLAIFYNYNRCNAFYNGVHGESTTTYKFKDEIYTSEYCSYTGCTRCNSTIEKPEADALITNKGYSVNTIDGVGITYTIVFNPTAIKKYEELAKTTFEYGLIAATTNVVEDGVLFDATGTAVDKNAIVTGFAGTDYTIYNLKITSIPEESQETGIYACAYVIDTSDAGVKTINYVGDAVATKAEAVTYQAISQKESTNS